jgi:hypothetical protein
MQGKLKEKWGSIRSTIRADVAPDIAYFTKPNGDINDILLY